MLKCVMDESGHILILVFAQSSLAQNAKAHTFFNIFPEIFRINIELNFASFTCYWEF